MSDTANKSALAKSVFNTLCETLDKKEWKYEKHIEELIITFSASGDDLPMDFLLLIDEDRQLIRLFSFLPFIVEEDKRMEMAVATCAASFGLPDGSFDYNISKGKISFRLTATFRDSKIGEELFNYLVACSGTIVDHYNDKFFALNKGYLSLEDFLKDA